MAPCSSTLAWKIPWTEEPGGLQSMGSRRVRHDWATSLSLFTFTHWRRKWQPTPVFLPGESQGRGSLVGYLYGVAQSRTRLKRLSSSSSMLYHELLMLCKRVWLLRICVCLKCVCGCEWVGEVMTLSSHPSLSTRTEFSKNVSALSYTLNILSWHMVSIATTLLLCNILNQSLTIHEQRSFTLFSRHFNNKYRKLSLTDFHVPWIIFIDLIFCQTFKMF